MTLEQETKVLLRIACPEVGYPFSEARYGSIEEYERETGSSFQKTLNKLKLVGEAEDDA